MLEDPSYEVMYAVCQCNTSLLYSEIDDLKRKLADKDKEIEDLRCHIDLLSIIPEEKPITEEYCEIND